MDEKDHDMLIADHEQIGRIVSDIESEKDTRRRRNIDLKERLDKIMERLDKHQFWFGLGIGGGWVAILLFELWAKR